MASVRACREIRGNDKLFNDSGLFILENDLKSYV